MPSQRSRESGFYYAHPTNQFWRLIGAVCSQDPPVTVEDKIRMLLDRRIALWDVFASAEISASSDASIKRSTSAGAEASWIAETKIKHFFVNGRKAAEGYNWFLRDFTGTDAVYLPSSSAANAGMSFEEKLQKWLIIRDYI